MAVLAEDASNLTHFVIGVLALFALRSFFVYISPIPRQICVGVMAIGVALSFYV